MLDAGTLRHRVELQRLDTTADDGYAPVKAWTPYAQRWADVRPIRGTERLERQGVNAQTAYRIRLRYDPQIQPTDRIDWDGTLIDLTAVLNVDGLGIVAECEGVSHG